MQSNWLPGRPRTNNSVLKCFCDFEDVPTIYFSSCTFKPLNFEISYSYILSICQCYRLVSRTAGKKFFAKGEIDVGIIADLGPGKKSLGRHRQEEPVLCCSAQARRAWVGPGKRSRGFAACCSTCCCCYFPFACCCHPHLGTSPLLAATATSATNRAAKTGKQNSSKKTAAAN